ncbi:MAG: CHAT domain-containing protein [Paludibacteraceae bacterium]|nr:CHAT domain-containing protein [Paludibacteraceae bacterium]
MRRFLIILLVLASSLALFARSSRADKQKQRLIENINKGNFDKALRNIKKVEDWSFDEENVSLYVNINSGLNFFGYADSIGFQIPAVDSLAIYIAQESEILGYYNYYYSDYNNALPYYKLSSNIYKSILGENHSQYAASLGNLGILYMTIGDYTEAEQYYLQSLESIKSILGENNPQYAASLMNLGLLYSDMGDYSKAEQYYLESLEITKNVLGENHAEYATSLNNLGGLYSDIGDYSKAKQYYLQSLEIRRNIFGENHPMYAASLLSLGNLYFNIGNYSKAEQYYLEKLDITKNVFGKDHLDYATSLHNLGILYRNIGDYSKAEQYHLVALKIINNILGENHPQYATALMSLGSLYSVMGDYSKAEQYYLEALSLRKNNLGENHPDYAMSLMNLGLLYSDIGDYSKAEQYYLESLDIKKRIFGVNHPQYAASLNNLGRLYSSIGDYSKAEQYYLESLNIKKKILGENHPNCAMSLTGLGLLSHNMGDYSKAEQYFLKNKNITESVFLQSLDYMSEQQRELFWNTIKTTYEYTYPKFTYRYKTAKPDISIFAYNNELFTKGLLLNSSESIKRSIIDSRDTTLIRQYSELVAKKQQIIVLEEKNPQSEYLNQIKQEAEQLEKELTRNSAALRQSREQWTISCDSVRLHLAENQVAIEYMVAPLNADSTMYCALLLRNSSEYPDLIPLFEEKEVLALINTTSENNTNFTYSFDDNGKQLADLVWGKILPHVRQGETIYFAPSGLLHQLAVEALPYDETHTMADIFNLVRLSSTREIVMRRSEIKHSDATLYGGIEYNMTGEELLAESEQYKTTDLPDFRSIANDTTNRGTVVYLKGTKTEVENINRMLKDNNLAVQLFTSTAANEESFKALSGKHQNILHIATHGFFWTDSAAHRKDYFSQRMMPIDNDQMPSPPAIDPLNRCGLLLAGANTALSGHSSELPDGVQDGILTAKEISLLNLRDAELVVLSACETGKGEITGEGVFGLQRAFKQAGAQTIIMSLWPVNDAATQLLMTEFYRNWITKNQSKREAFRNAQNTIRSRFPEPTYWAGFVMLD